MGESTVKASNQATEMDAGEDENATPTISSTNHWRNRLWIFLLVLVLIIRMYGKLKDTARTTLAEGEWPREDDVVIVGLPSVSTALVAALQASGMTAVPDLEQGSTRAALATTKFPPWPYGFWLEPTTAARTAATSRLEQTAVSLDLRIFSSYQMRNPAAVGALELSSSDDIRGDCGKEMLPYVCLCPNCPVRWSTIVYVVDAEPCRTYGVSWIAHVSSYVEATNASVSLLLHAGDHAHEVLRPLSEQHYAQHILIVRDEDIRARPGASTAAVLAWILDTKRKLHQLDQHHLQVDHDHIAARINAIDRTLEKWTPKVCKTPLNNETIDSYRSLLEYKTMIYHPFVNPDDPTSSSTSSEL